MTNELARYRNLLAVRADKTFDVSASEIALARRFSEQPIVEIVTGAGRPFFVRRHCERQAAPAKMYRVFGDARSAKEERGAIGFCRIVGPVDGLGRISNAGVSPPFQRHGIASAVYDLIATDLASVGALLWPASPADMGDAEFKIWWRRASALVFYYPHRQRLGFAPRAEYESLLEDGAAMQQMRTIAGAIGPRQLLAKLARAGSWLTRRFAVKRD